MKKPLWSPSEDRVSRSEISLFIASLNRERSKAISGYQELYRWSIEENEVFWDAVWKFAKVRSSRGYDSVTDRSGKFPGTVWFPGARLNFAENLLRRRDDHPALFYRNEIQTSSQITFRELYGAVARLARSLRAEGIQPGDRVAAFMPNRMETIIAMLAATSVGAVWSSCGTELGPQAVIDRIGQIAPKILFAVSSYSYKGKQFDLLPAILTIGGAISSFKRVVVVPFLEKSLSLQSMPKAISYASFLSPDNDEEIKFEQLPFNHPLYIMFSSGTTGKPKCMVQGAGGVLINHLKELILHTDLKESDRLFYITSPSWMMWNWMASGLAVGATLLLYDGNPGYPDWRTIWNLVERDRVTVLGCSASYIHFLKGSGVKPGASFDLSSLKEISQTGSPLSAEAFEYVYHEIKSDLHLNSISGGTDINGCFAAGSPIQPVYAGEIQGPALGMKVRAYDETGTPVMNREGELVCEGPSPSMPLHFWNDPDGMKYQGSYFKQFPGVWRHGDWVVFHEDTGGITFLGRSDFTLKPSGVRIGPSEIYNVVEQFKEIADSLVVGQEWKGDQRILLFVKPAACMQLTDELKKRIKDRLLREASPRHVPAMILEAPDIPYTFSMKKVESAVVNILHGRPVTNRDALINPEALDYFVKLAPDLREK